MSPGRYASEVDELRSRWASNSSGLTWHLNQKLASSVLTLIPHNASPSLITVLAFLVNAVAAASLILFGEGPGGAAAFLLLGQVAYTLDCLDGQHARRTNRATSAGGVLDVHLDILGGGLLAAAVVHTGGLAPWAGVLASVGWISSTTYASVAGRSLDRTQTGHPTRRHVLAHIQDHSLRLSFLTVGLAIGYTGIAVIAFATADWAAALIRASWLWRESARPHV